MTRAALYVRISADHTGEGLGVARQQQDCEALAAMRGYDVVEVCSDNDISALTKDKRPGFERALELMKRGEVSAVVAWNFERVLKTRRDQLRFIEVGQEREVTLALVRGTDLDMATSGGRLMADLLASIARNETELKSERQVRANLQRAQAGQPHKARRAYGYEQDGVTIKEAEAAVLRDMAGKFLKGWSFTEIASYLNEHGHQTAMGNKFVGVAIRQMLMRKRYAAIREHDGVEYPATWLPIFDDEMWARIQYTLRERSARADSKPKPRRALLTGLIYCGSCGASMNGTTTYDRKTKEPRKSYRCNRSRLDRDGNPGCGKVSRGQVPLDHFIRELIVYRLDTEELQRLLAGDRGGELSDLLARRDTHTAKLNELTDDYADGTLDKAAYKRASGRVRGHLSDVERKIETLQRQSLSVSLSAGQSVADAWDENSDGFRRQLISLVVDKILVHSSNKHPRYKVGDKTFYFDPDSIEIRWSA